MPGRTGFGRIRLLLQFPQRTVKGRCASAGFLALVALAAMQAPQLIESPAASAVSFPSTIQSFGFGGFLNPTGSSSAPAVVGGATTFVSSSSTTPTTFIPPGAVSGDVLVSLINTSTSAIVTCPSG